MDAESRNITYKQSKFSYWAMHEAEYYVPKLKKEYRANENDPWTTIAECRKERGKANED